MHSLSSHPEAVLYFYCTIFGRRLSFICCLADLCSGISLSGVIGFGCKYDKLGTDKDFTENSRTLSLFPLSWPHFMCCGPKKCIKSFFSRMIWVLGLNVIRSVLLTNSELIALQLVLVVVCLRVKAFQVECLCVRAVRLNFMGIEFECQQIRY